MHAFNVKVSMRHYNVHTTNPSRYELYINHECCLDIKCIYCFTSVIYMHNIEI